MNPHFVEILKAFRDEGVEHLVIGAHALAAHGHVRATLDIDIWVKPTEVNAGNTWRALQRFGAPRSRLSPASFTQPDVVYQIGLPPNRIDFLTTIDGVAFDDAWAEKVPCVVSGIAFNMLSLRHLLENKRATGRPQDLADVARLEAAE